MSDACTFTGELRSTPQLFSPSGDPTIDALVSESAQLANKQAASMVLGVDGPVVVPFGTIVSARVILIKTFGGKVTARFTSADGTTQSVPVDSFVLLFCSSVPVTAIDLARVPGVTTNVRIFLGE